MNIKKKLASFNSFSIHDRDNINFLNLVSKQKKNPFILGLHGQKISNETTSLDVHQSLISTPGPVNKIGVVDFRIWDSYLYSLIVFSKTKRFLQGMSPNKWADSQGLPHFPEEWLTWFKNCTTPPVLEIVSHPSSLMNISKSKHFNSCLWSSYPQRLLSFAFFPTSFCVQRKDRAGNVMGRLAFWISNPEFPNEIIPSTIYGNIGTTQDCIESMIRNKFGFSVLGARDISGHIDFYMHSEYHLYPVNYSSQYEEYKKKLKKLESIKIGA